MLDKDGNDFNNIMGAGGVGKGCDQKDCYISDGTERTYEPAFTFHGFRYVKVSGIANVNPDDFKAVVLSTEKQDLGTFVTSDERINRLYENTRWSQRSNMMSIPTDCPQREKSRLDRRYARICENCDVKRRLYFFIYKMAGKYGL